MILSYPSPHEEQLQSCLRLLVACPLGVPASLRTETLVYNINAFVMQLILILFIVILVLQDWQSRKNMSKIGLDVRKRYFTERWSGTGTGSQEQWT